MLKRGNWNVEWLLLQWPSGNVEWLLLQWPSGDGGERHCSRHATTRSCEAVARRRQENCRLAALKGACAALAGAGRRRRLTGEGRQQRKGVGSGREKEEAGARRK